jgi:hypothetical protein
MNGTMQAIDSAQFSGRPFVKDQCSAVSIMREDGVVTGRLAHVDSDGVPQPIQTFVRR